MKKAKHVFWELALIISSVLVFRSIWVMMDSFDFLSRLPVLGVTFVLGAILLIIAFYKLTHSD